MEGRNRTRRYLSGEETDRPPFLALATDLTARLAQIEPQELFSDPHVLTESFIQTAAVCRLECVLLRPPSEDVVDAVRSPDPLGHQTLAVVREAVTRLRALLQDRVAIGLLLPGPWLIGRSLDREPTPAALEGTAGSLLQIAQSLDPPSLDLLGVLEEDTLAAQPVAAVVSSLSAFWNSARYYSVPSLFLASDAGPATGGDGATAAARWQGASAEELLATGTPRAGVPVDISVCPPMPALPQGGFWLSNGEIPQDTEVRRMQEIAAAVEGGT